MRAELSKWIAVSAASYALDYALFVLSWWLLGQGVLSGTVEWSWLTAWALLFPLMLPFRVLSTWSAGRVAVTAGSFLKRRLLEGAMRLAPDELRADGAGRHLARVFESERVESLAIGGGLLSAAAAIELLVILGLTLVGGSGRLQGAILIITLFLFGLLARRYLGERRLWTEQRLEMSHDGVEKMVGHRTRLAQERPDTWHISEEQVLDAYDVRSKRVDRLQALLNAAPRAWLPIGVIAAAWEQASLASLAAGVGCAILASRALVKLSDGLPDLLDAAIAWREIALLYEAASREMEQAPKTSPNRRPLMEARDVFYSYPNGRGEVLKGVHVELTRGDRVLLTSPSGGGKSTLVSLINGLREPSRGEVLREGKFATAPQFHENHVFTESFAFNLLMGRRWPPTGEDLREAEALARELGLGDLLDKMPGGMNQLVGDTGWRLSHGERSRLFLARALLQSSKVVLLDESFAALDPENLRQALVTARERSETLVVVTHL
jgi:ATP-binding cassette subfamily B protein